MDWRRNSDDIYRRQLDILKKQVLRLTKPEDIQLCTRWIERFKRCQPHERNDRNRLLDELNKQLQCGHVDADLFGPTQAIDRLQLDKVLADVLNKTGRFSVADSDEASSLGGDYMRYLNMSVGFEIASNQLEDKLTKAGTSANALQDLQGLLSPDLWSEFLPECFLPKLRRIESKWLHVIDRLRAQIVENTNTSTLTQVTSASSTGSNETEPVKYKRFALKSARRIARLRAEIANLQRDQQLRACTESISNVARRTAWKCSADAQQQMPTIELIDAMIKQKLQQQPETLTPPNE